MTWRQQAVLFMFLFALSVGVTLVALRLQDSGRVNRDEAFWLIVIPVATGGVIVGVVIALVTVRRMSREARRNVERVLAVAKPPPSGTDSELRLIRRSRWLGRAWLVEVRVDGEFRGTLPYEGGELRLPVRTGRHTVQTYISTQQQVEGARAVLSGIEFDEVESEKVAVRSRSGQVVCLDATPHIPARKLARSLLLTPVWYQLYQWRPLRGLVLRDGKLRGPFRSINVPVGLTLEPCGEDSSRNAGVPADRRQA